MGGLSQICGSFVGGFYLKVEEMWVLVENYFLIVSTLYVPCQLIAVYVPKIRVILYVPQTFIEA